MIYLNKQKAFSVKLFYHNKEKYDSAKICFRSQTKLVDKKRTYEEKWVLLTLIISYRLTV